MRAAEALGPFDERDCRLEGLFEAKLQHFVGMAEPVKVGVPDRWIGGIGLHQGEGGRGHVFNRIVQPRPDQRPCEMRFAGADRPFEQQRVARFKPGGKAFGQAVGRFGRRQVEDQALRHGGKSIPAMAMRKPCSGAQPLFGKDGAGFGSSAQRAKAAIDRPALQAA